MLGSPLPQGLAQEGDLMLTAVVKDLLNLTKVSIVTARDPRLCAIRQPIEVITLGAEDDCWHLWRDLIEDSDALWPIAPETGGTLERLSQMALMHQRVLLGSSPGAIRVAASKLATTTRLRELGIPAVQTVPLSSYLPPNETGWVVKPDDGTGCEDTHLFKNQPQLDAWRGVGAIEQSYVAQMFIPGIPASVSMLCCNGQAWVLACNRQRIEFDTSGCHLRGIIVNGLRDERLRLMRLASDIAKAIPGLWGYVGIDFVMTPTGPIVLEVNPRLTTSYIGLGCSIGQNPAKLVLALLDGSNRLLNAPLSDEPVDIDLERVNG